MKKKHLLLLALALIGGIFSFLLIQVDINLLKGVENTTCNFSEAISCDAVAASAFSHLGGVPVSVIGFFFYLFVLAYLFFQKEEATLSLTLAWLFVLASAASLFLFGISWFVIKSFCPWCFVTYLVNWGGLLLLRKDIKWSFKPIFRTAHLKTLLLPLVLGVILSAGLYTLMKGDAGKKPDLSGELIEAYKNGKVHELNTMFAPYIGATDPKIEIVSYSSFFCGHCINLTRTLENLLEDPKYKQTVRFYYKPFNHAAACTADADVCWVHLLAFEMTRQGLFWEFDRQWSQDPAQPTKDKAFAIAGDLNREPLNPAQVKQNNIEYLLQVGEEGTALGVNGTPTWFINGRQVVGSRPYQDIKILFDYILEQDK